MLLAGQEGPGQVHTAGCRLAWMNVTAADSSRRVFAEARGHGGRGLDDGRLSQGAQADQG